MERWQTCSFLLLGLLSLSDGQFKIGRPSLVEIRLSASSRDLKFFQPSRLIAEPTLSSLPRFTLLAPDLLRTDSQENIYLQADGVSSSSLNVSISVQDFSKTKMLLQDSVTLNTQNKFQALKTIQIPSELLNSDEKKNKFVYLQVNFEGFHSEERVLQVNFHSGYIFIQTDKPIYNPGDIVRLRAFVSSLDFKAFDSFITIEIQNPDGMVVRQISRVKATEGIFTELFPLSELVAEGLWVLSAKFDHWPQNTFTSQFEVKKYVLPAFNVTLTPKSSFLSLDDKELEVEISARYLYGQSVQGTAYVVFGVKINKDKIRLPSMKQVSELDKGVVKLSMDELKAAYPNIRSLVGQSIYVKASVLTNTGSDLVEAEKTGIKIVESPYMLYFKDMPKFFKPGLPLDFTIQVSHHDGSPAQNVPVKLNFPDAPLMLISGSARATINMPSEGGQQIITAETTQDGLRPEQQARHQISVQPYTAFDRHLKNYLYISTQTNMVSVGEPMSLKLFISTADPAHKDYIQYITYLVFSKGKIQTAERIDVRGRLETTVNLLVTADMMPSFRFVAFYSINWERREEVVSDSIWVDVRDSCVGGLKVRPVGDDSGDYAPGKSFRFQIRGDPGSKVSLVAVDNAVFLLNKDRLTQKKIWDVVEGGDVGCSRGGGQEASAVFSDAGILYSSSRGFHTKTRPAQQCSGRARRRRSPELVQRKARLESHYKEKLLRRCCKDGLKGIPMPYSCTRRSLYITEGFECILAFRYCCATYRDQDFNTQMPTTPLPTTTMPYTTPMPPTTTSLPFVTLHSVFSRMEFRDRSMFRRVEYSAKQPSPPVSGEMLVKQFSRVDSRVLQAPPFKLPTALQELVDEVVEEVVDEVEEEEWASLDESNIYLRSKFFESWLWRDVTLPTEVEGDGCHHHEGEFCVATLKNNFIDRPGSRPFGLICADGIILY